MVSAAQSVSMSGYHSYSEAWGGSSLLHTESHISEVIAAKHLSHMSYISLRPLCLPLCPRTQTSPQCPLKLDNANGWICKHTHVLLHFQNVFVHQVQAHKPQTSLVTSATPISQERLYILGLWLFPPTCLLAADRLMGG